MSRDSSQTAAAEMSPSLHDNGGSGATRGPDGPPGPSENPAGPAVYRTASGWRVGEEDLPDLVNAMALADLLAGERTPPAPPSADVAAGEPETAKLKLTVAQLEHALANRVRIEQAIGTLAERHRLPPRRAFELLRGAARSRGRRVHELAGEVVQSITNPLLPLPEELARAPKPQRSRGRPRPV
jgi:ANTAR domain